MMTRAAPQKTHALVVGIEKYAVPGWSGLDGPALDACRFTDWLLAREVPPENIRLFLSPLAKNAGARPSPREDGAHARVVVRPAAQFEVMPYVTQLQELDDIDLLFVFWGGHGLSDAMRSRYLLFADATKRSVGNLRLDGWLQSLQSSSYPGIRSQIVIVDACANDKRELGIALESLSSMTPGVGDARQPSQYVLYASQLGQAAMNLDDEQTGALSREVLRALADQSSLPPDMDVVTERVEAAFKAMQHRGAARQVPVYSVTNWAGTERRHIAAAAPDDYCEIASLMYDRETPESKFWPMPGELLSAEATARAQVYLVPGETREQHRSFVSRMLGTRVRECADAWLGTEDSSFARVEPGVEWPATHGMDAAALRQQLHVAFVKALGVRDAPPRADAATGWQVLARHPYAGLPLVVIPHLMSLTGWGFTDRRRQEQLLRWYVDQYWARPPAAAPEPRQPRVMLFLLLVCDETMAQQGRIARRLGMRCAKDGAMRDIGRALLAGPVSAPGLIARLLGSHAPASPPPDASTVSRVVLPELVPLELVHLERWFLKWVHPLERGDDYEYSKEAAALYADAKERRDGIRRTDDIESRLNKRYKMAAAAAGKDR